MLTSDTALFLMMLLLVAAVVEPLAKKLPVPFSVVLVIIGFMGSELVVKTLGIDTGIRWDNFGTIIFYFVLPILIFQAALEIDLELLWKNIVPIGLLALPLMLVSAVVIAACVYRGIDHAVGFPWMAALITGALLSATDPAAVLALLKNANAPERLNMLLEGESLFNDATAVVMFSLLIAIATGAQSAGSVDEVILRFATVFFGGLAVGIIVALFLCLMMKIIGGFGSFPLLSLICAYTAFLVAEDLLHLSGVMAVLAAGLTVGKYRRELTSEIHNDFAEKFWGLLGHIAESTIFLLAGITITLSMFTEQWLAIIIGIIAVVIARIVMVFGTFPILKVLPGVDAVPLKQQVVLAWGGVRGTVTLALALSLPLTLDYWYTIQSIAYGVVLFTLFVQATTMSPLIKKLDIA
ncbi:MAG: sodium:proton antiporter [Gammaproteobacteria bacterium]